MFCGTPDNHHNNIFNSTVLQNNSRRKRQKKLKRKNKRKGQGVKKDLFKKSNVRPPVPIIMSSWAENYTFAATWQLKHQIAFWKSKATALEYENKMLHDIIRRKCGNLPSLNVPNDDTTLSYSENDETEEPPSNESENESENEPEEEEILEDGDIEVSEEFIQFLRENKKFRDDAKREREKLKADYSEEKKTEELEAGPPEDAKDPQEVLKMLYGDSSDRIAALETSLRSNYINFIDHEKPMYWPNIPFNFNFG